MRDIVDQLMTLTRSERFEGETLESVCLSAAEYIEQLRAKAKRVIERHDNGTLGNRGDSLSIELLRGLIETKDKDSVSS